MKATSPAKDHFYVTVGNRILFLREQAGLSRRKLADSCGLASTTIDHAEHGMSCSLMVLAQIAHALDCTLDELVPLEALK